MTVQITFGFTLDVWVALGGWPQALEVWLYMLGVVGADLTRKARLPDILFF